MLLLTIECAEDSLSADDVRAHYGLGPDDLDSAYGVIQVDDHAFSVRVTEEAHERMKGRDGWRLEGPFADPAIAPVSAAR
jgi:hypothetical protein